MSNSKHAVLKDILRIYAAARDSHDGHRSMVAPHPNLQETLKQQLASLRAAAPEVAHLLKIKGRSTPGLDDGLIYPGDMFPLGTPARVVRSAAADRAPPSGALRVAVVLVQFPDKGMTHSKAHFEDLFFSIGKLPHGSVREYYRAASNGSVDIIGQVLGPYTLPKKLSEYANGASGTGAALPNARTMANDAAVASNPALDYSTYDNDHDGFVDAFIVVHAGAGAEVTGSPNDIWSHKWVLSDGAYTADGATKIYAYLTVPEDARAGVCCHELGHLLFGLPDLYDTDYSSSGVGDWCLMGGGSWNGGGDIPANLSAWCLATLGWAATVSVGANADLTIPDVKDSHKVYRLWKDGAPGNEYFLLENRQKKGFDSALPGDGLLIWHIDESIGSNSDESHPKVALVQADGNKDLELGSNRGDAGDPFPGTGNKTKFDNSSTPNSQSYGRVSTCVSVTSISASAPIMTAKVAVKCVVKIKDFKDVKDSQKESAKELKKELSKEIKKEVTKELNKESLKEILKENEKAIAKEVEKPVTDKSASYDKPFDKYSEKLADLPGGGLGGFGGVPREGGWQDTVEARLAALESLLGSAAPQPFIDAALRPDLSTSALNSEEDSTAGTKRLMDTGPTR